MTAETWHLSGSVSFTGKQKGQRAELEDNAETMLMDICLYAAGKYPGYTFDAHRVNVRQTLSERLK